MTYIHECKEAFLNLKGKQISIKDWNFRTGKVSREWGFLVAVVEVDDLIVATLGVVIEPATTSGTSALWLSNENLCEVDLDRREIKIRQSKRHSLQLVITW